MNPRHQCTYYTTIETSGRFVRKLLFWQPGKIEHLRCTLRTGHFLNPNLKHSHVVGGPNDCGCYFDHLCVRANGSVHFWKTPVYERKEEKK
jgi:hypothetical protein